MSAWVISGHFAAQSPKVDVAKAYSTTPFGSGQAP